MSCRRDLQITPSRCADSGVCGMFCTNAAVSGWKIFGKDAKSKALVEQRRTERSHVIQQIMHLLKRHFRIYLLSLPSVASRRLKELPPASSRSQSVTEVLLQECSCVKLLVHIAKHIELLIYRSAFSKPEYDNSATLFRRVQHFAMVMSCNPRWKVKVVMKQEQESVQSSTIVPSPRTLEDKKKRLWLFSPSRWGTHVDPQRARAQANQGVLINANERCYRSIVALASAKHSRSARIRIDSASCDHREPSISATKNAGTEAFSSSPFAALFQGHCSTLLTQIFGFLDGASVVRNFALSKLCHSALPRAITDLRISTTALAPFLLRLNEGKSNGGSCILPNLQHLCVFAENASSSTVFPCHRDKKRARSLSSNTSQAANHSVVASSCPPQRASTRSSGEFAIATLAQVLATNGCPQLRKLCMCSTFVNSFSGNGIFHLTEALRAGCCPELVYLWLGGNALGDYGAMRISQVIQANACPKLAFLDLRSNVIAHDGMRYLAGAFSSLAGKCLLKQLCLGDNLITPAVFQELVPCFRRGSMKELVFLGLDRNFLSRECVDTLAAQLVDGKCPNLKELCVGGNAGLTETDISFAFRDIADSTEGSSWGLFRASPTVSPSRAGGGEGRSKRQRVD